MIYQAMWDTEQIGVKGIRPDGRLDLHAIDYQHIRSKFDVDGADATIGFPLARLIAVSEI